MTRDEFLNLYAKLTSKLSDSELEQLHNLLCKFEIETQKVAKSKIKNNHLVVNVYF